MLYIRMNNVYTYACINIYIIIINLHSHKIYMQQRSFYKVTN